MNTYIEWEIKEICHFQAILKIFPKKTYPAENEILRFNIGIYVVKMYSVYVHNYFYGNGLFTFKNLPCPSRAMIKFLINKN